MHMTREDLLESATQSGEVGVARDEDESARAHLLDVDLNIQV